MIVVDTSSLIAILLLEEGAERHIEALHQSDDTLISAANFVETAIVLRRKGRDPILSDLRELTDRVNIVVEPVTRVVAEAAIEAYANFGKGSGSAANLNFGDSFAYALAKTTQRPLLYKGNDFSATDVKPVLSSGA